MTGFYILAGLAYLIAIISFVTGLVRRAVRHVIKDTVTPMLTNDGQSVARYAHEARDAANDASRAANQAKEAAIEARAAVIEVKDLLIDMKAN